MDLRIALRRVHHFMDLSAHRLAAAYPIVPPEYTPRAPAQLAPRLVDDRDRYIRAEEIDPRFALPGGNWAHDSENEFVRVYRRVLSDERARGYLRFFCQSFTGHSLYWVKNARGVSVADLAIEPETVARRLRAWNGPHIKRWLQIRDDRFVFSPPRAFGECGHKVDGVIVNADTAAYQERITLMRLAGLLDGLRAPKILEIGGGYGALARWFLTTFPGCSYTIVDLPESLLFAEIYLSGLGVHLVPNYAADGLTERFDLVINTLSMSEMTEHQIRRYAELIKGWGPFFEQNQDNRYRNLMCAEDIFAEVFLRRERVRGILTKHGSANVWS